jgi:phospholipid/cholesterol/gamma-HCH transport system substrate-binding protein
MTMTREFRLGAFIVVTLLMLASGVFLIGSRESLFQPTYLVKADFPNVAGLNVGADVRVGGIREGTVKRVNLPAHPDGEVTVIVDLDKSTRDIVKSDSVAAIRSEGLLGDKYVEISFGSGEAAPPRDGDTIASSPPFDISDLMAKTNQILDSATETVRNAQATTSNLKSVSSKIDQGQGTLGALVNDKTIYEQASAGVTSPAKKWTHSNTTFWFVDSSGIVDMRTQMSSPSTSSRNFPLVRMRGRLSSTQNRFSTSRTPRS